MKIEIQEKKNVYIMELDGRLTIEQDDDFFREFVKIINKTMKPKAIIIECTKLSFIDSTGIGYLVRCMKKATPNKIQMHLTCVNEDVLKIIKIARLDKFLSVAKWDDLERKYFEDSDIDELINSI
jgi:anti-sigma B factor antagonist